MSGPNSKRGIVLGLVGPVCAGKTAVARLLQQRGAVIYHADAVVRRLYDQPEVKQAVRELFGNEVFDANGAVNRAAIACRIFGPHGDPELRRSLTEKVIFPRTGQTLRVQIDRFRDQAGPRAVLVVDAPTLFEAGRADWCDRILLVTAPVAQRRQWAAERGWADGELEARDLAMIPEAVKRQRADCVIENAGSLGDLDAAVVQLWDQLLSLSG